MGGVGRSDGISSGPRVDRESRLGIDGMGQAVAGQGGGQGSKRLKIALPA